MLRFRQHDAIPRRNIGITPAIGHQVNTFGGVACENHLLTLASIDEARHLHTRLLHPGRCLFADLVDAAMHIGMRGFVVGTHGLDDGMRLLRTGSAVQVDQWVPMYLTGQDRKVYANVCGAAHLRLLHCCHMLPDFFTLPGRGQAPLLPDCFTRAGASPPRTLYVRRTTSNRIGYGPGLAPPLSGGPL